MAKKSFLGMQILSIVLIICYVGLAWAQEAEEKTLVFPTSQEEIVQILGIKPPEDILRPRGGLKSGGNDRSLFGGGQSRGVGGIAYDEGIDEELLASAPKVGALVLFDFDSTAIKDESTLLLKEFALAFQHPTLQDAVFVIAGHTDSKGSEKYNLMLSRQRAEAVKNYLSDNYAIAKERLIVKAFGELAPIESNETDEGRAKNRRVEFIRVQ